MLAQNIKALLLLVSVIMAIFGIAEYSYNVPSYLGFIGVAFIFLLASNIVDLIDKWHGERRKVDLGVDKRAPWILRDQAD